MFLWLLLIFVLCLWFSDVLFQCAWVWFSFHLSCFLFTRHLKINDLKSFVNLEIPQQLTLQIIVSSPSLSFPSRNVTKPILDILTISSVFYPSFPLPLQAAFWIISLDVSSGSLNLKCMSNLHLKSCVKFINFTHKIYFYLQNIHIFINFI